MTFSGFWVLRTGFRGSGPRVRGAETEVGEWITTISSNSAYAVALITELSSGGLLPYALNPIP